MLTVRAQPAMRRLVDAFGSMASEVHYVEAQSDRNPACTDWRQSLIRGHRRVIALYREVLAVHDMPRAERALIEDRIARIEAELRALSGELEAGPPQDRATTKEASLRGSGNAGFHYQNAA